MKLILLLELENDLGNEKIRSHVIFISFLEYIA